MFQKDNKLDSIASAVRDVMEASPVKIATPTGTKVLGTRYGNSAKTHREILADPFAGHKGPKNKDLEDIEKPKKKEESFSYFTKKLMNVFNEDREIQKQIDEVLSKDASAGDWIHDFVHSDNPKFKGKSKAERKKMALGAYYAKQNEEVEEIDEKLIGNQKKIDKNHNNKIDSQDFKILRGQKKTNEETEQIDELSKGTLSSYLTKKKSEFMKGKTQPGTKEYNKDVQSMGKAHDKMKEEVEQIDELKKSTLGSYVKGAARDMSASRKIATDFEHREKRSKKPSMKAAASSLSDKFNRYARKRNAGIGKAVERLTKEEVEQIDELSLGTLQSARKKASDAWKTAWKNYDDKTATKRLKLTRKLNSRLAGSKTTSEEVVLEGEAERKQNALWAQITHHEKSAKATKNDIKKQHHINMANQLRGQLKTNEEVESVDEAQSMLDALKNSLSKPEPGSKLDKKIKHHNSLIRAGHSGNWDKPHPPEGHRFDKKGYIRLGEESEQTDESYFGPRGDKLLARSHSAYDTGDKETGKRAHTLAMKAGEKYRSNPVNRAKATREVMAGASADYNTGRRWTGDSVEYPEDINVVSEISDTTLASYKEKAKKSADTLHAQGQYKKSANRWMNIMKATGKQMNKMKFENTLDPKAATEAPCDCGCGDTEPLPKDKNKKLIQMSKSARIIKSIYKKKNMKEETYDHEKEDKSVATYGKKPKLSDNEKKMEQVGGQPKAAAVMSGGTTLTGTPRDTVEIDPMMKLKPGLIGQTKNNNR